MPIQVHADLRPSSQDEFAAIAYQVMGVTFEVHNDIGRFFDEHIYKYRVAGKLGSTAELEIPIDVTFGTFRKRYYIDMLVDGTAVFEWKAASSTTRSGHSLWRGLQGDGLSRESGSLRATCHGVCALHFGSRHALDQCES
ncbi:MAG: hypothetical protein NXI32_12820 [bacterium]|nr:hypothetical protein [bacterium]